MNDLVTKRMRHDDSLHPVVLAGATAFFGAGIIA